MGANIAASSTLSVISTGNGQFKPAVASRCNVNRTVDGATPTRRAISLSPTPALLKRSTSRTRRIGILSAGIRFPRAKATRADPNRASRGVAYPSDIIPEFRAKSSWNAERDQIGMLGEIIPDSRATSPGIRSFDAGVSGFYAEGFHHHGFRDAVGVVLTFGSACWRCRT